MAYNESCCNIYHCLSTYYYTVTYFMVHCLLYSIVFWKIICGNLINNYSSCCTRNGRGS